MSAKRVENSMILHYVFFAYKPKRNFTGEDDFTIKLTLSNNSQNKDSLLDYHVVIQ